MGRYYKGDIEGKFWFAVQSSDDADFFGVTGTEPNYLEYYFEESDLENVEEGIAQCLKELGDDKKKLDDFFEKHDGYNDKMLQEAGFDLEKVKELFKWYARLHLGEKIAKCIRDTGSCSFEAEL